MNIKGLHKTSLIDYPGKISAVIFTGGCNLRCGFCHNGELALNSPSLPPISRAEVINFLKNRTSLLDAVTISGGEPSINSGLYNFISEVRALGFSVKLDTNGFNPDALKALIDNQMVDYFALDIKTSPSKYPQITGVDCNFDPVLKSFKLIHDSGIEYELRMTCVPGFCEKEDLVEIGKTLGSVRKFYLQQFVNELAMNSEFTKLSPHSADYLFELKNVCLAFSTTCAIRGF